MRSGKLVGAAENSRAWRMAQVSAEKLKHIGPTEKKRVASVLQRKQLATKPETPLPKETEPFVQSTRL